MFENNSKMIIVKKLIAAIKGVNGDNTITISLNCQL